MIKIEAAQRLKAERKSEYVQRLKDMGIKQLGKGAWADVFQHPTMKDVAVKVSIWDPGFSAYTKFCTEHPKNPYLLKIVSVHSEPAGSGFNFEGNVGDRPGAAGRTSSIITFLEKLTPASESDIKKFVARCEALAGLTLTGKTFNLYHSYGNEDMDMQLWTGLAKQNQDPNLRQFATWYVKKIQGDSIPDIYDDNVMMRRNQIVFSDPLS